MKWHLDHSPARPGFTIRHSDQLMLVGSCFSENIGTLLNVHRFTTLNNPTGILFNPLSIADALENILHLEAVDETCVVERDGRFLSFLHHSALGAANSEELLQKLQSANERAHHFLKEADHLIITFGTAYYYYHLALNTVVANCHKQPAQTFEKRLAGVQEITSRYATLLNDLRVFNPKLRIIFTMSPVKHLKDGLVENTISKATLALGIHELIQHNEQCSYFPAYELVNDDLRDYRFYKDDMAHPNEQAINYVWEKFSQTFFNEQTQHVNDFIDKLNKALAHRSMNTATEATAKLRDYIEAQKAAIAKLLPDLEL